MVFTALLGAVSSADAYIYWSSYDSGNSRIGRAGLDGSGVNGELVTGIYFGAGVASDGTHVYWGESGNSPKHAQIGRATIDGGEPNHAFQDAATFCSVFGLRAAATQLFWLKNDCSGSSFSTRIDRASNAGSQGEYTEPGAGSGICGFTSDANYVYWSESHYIVRALNGAVPTLPESHWLDVGEGMAPCAVAVDSGHVYWTNRAPTVNSVGTTIGRATIDGNPASVNNSFIFNLSFFTSTSTPSGLAVDSNFIYWTNQPASGVIGSIGRANLDATGVDTSFIDDVFYPFSLAVDSAGPAPTPPGTGKQTYYPPPPPRIVAVGSSNGSFSVGGASTPARASAGASKAIPKGTVFTYKLDQAAAVTIVMQKVKSGRLKGGKCRKSTKSLARKPKCDLPVLSPLLRDGTIGSNRVPFTGRIKGKALTLGRYKAVFTAKAAGGTSKSASVAFRVVKP